MDRNRTAKLAAAASLAFGLATACWVVAASAQSQAQGAEAAQPSAPPGFIVTPPRPLARPHIQEFHYRLEPEAAAPETESQQNAPQSGGCRYEERKLDLLV